MGTLRVTASGHVLVRSRCSSSLNQRTVSQREWYLLNQLCSSMAIVSPSTTVTTPARCASKAQVLRTGPPSWFWPLFVIRRHHGVYLHQFHFKYSIAYTRIKSFPCQKK